MSGLDVNATQRSPVDKGILVAQHVVKIKLRCQR